MPISVASQLAVVSTVEYTINFVRANMKMREALSGGVRVVYSIPFLPGGTRNTSAIKTIAERNQRVASTSVLSNDTH